MNGLEGKRVLFLVNVDWFFLSHRLPLALAARERGADVLVVAADTGRGPAIEAAGLRFKPLQLSRQGRNPLREAASLLHIARLLRDERPDLVHQVAVKPVIYGSLVGMLVSRATPRVNAISGLGFSFSRDERARWIGRIVRALYRVGLRGNSVTIFQNRVDRDNFIAAKLITGNRTVLIRGSGVDLRRFVPSPPPDRPMVMLASRMLWEKGVGDFVAAAQLVRRQRADVRFALVGGPDSGNPTTIERQQLQQWHDEGVVEWWGHRADMGRVLSQATIVTLPTFYPEGVPKVLLEAAASGRPIVASDLPGCREVVTAGLNGLIVPVRDPHALAEAVITLLDDPERCAAMGRAGRAIVERDFAEETIVEQTLAVYLGLLGVRKPRASHHPAPGDEPLGS